MNSCHVFGIFNGYTTDREMLTKSTQKLTTLNVADAIFGDRRLAKQRIQPVHQVCALLSNIDPSIHRSIEVQRGH